MAKTKKVDVKAIAKEQVKASLLELFSDYEIVDCKETPIEGFTKDTLIIRNTKVEGVDGGIDVQIKLITPSAKTGNHYNIEEEDEQSSSLAYAKAINKQIYMKG